jgi:hypothetical protein
MRFDGGAIGIAEFFTQQPFQLVRRRTPARVCRHGPTSRN